MRKRVKPLEGFYNLQTTIEYIGADSFTIVSRYDGYGNSRIYFVLRINGKETPYEKFNSAAGAWNMHIDKLEAQKIAY